MTQKPSGNVDTLLQATSRVESLGVSAADSLFSSLFRLLLVCPAATQEQEGFCFSG